MSSKYTVFKNDLKYKQSGIDPTESEWFDDETKKVFEKENTSSINYRLKECQNNNYSLLDLSYMDLIKIPDLTKLSIYDKVKNIKMLFLHNNELTKITEKELKQFPNLEILDVSSNRIHTIEYLPDSIVELSCFNNLIVELSCFNNLIVELSCSNNNIDNPQNVNIKRLDCSGNKLTTINKIKTLEHLVCDKNNIKSLPTFENVTRIVCRDNPLTNIDNQPQLTYLDCTNTQLSGLFNSENNKFSKLEHLILNNTNISEISNNLNINQLEICNTKVNKLDYIKSLKSLVFTKNNNILLDSKYKIKNYNEDKLDSYVDFL